MSAEDEARFLREAVRVYGTTMQMAAERVVRPPADELLRVFGKALLGLAQPVGRQEWTRSRHGLA